jgi:hypothetical protein
MMESTHRDLVVRFIEIVFMQNEHTKCPIRELYVEYCAEETGEGGLAGGGWTREADDKGPGWRWESGGHDAMTRLVSTLGT